MDPTTGRKKVQEPIRARTRRLFGLFCTLTIVQSHPGTAAVFVDEFDASHLKCTSYKLKGGSTRLG
jgi:hypothetical protein